MTKRKIIILLVSFLFLLLIIFRLASGKGEEIMPKAKSYDENRYVKVQKISNDTVNVYIEGYGRVSSSRKITISSEVQGVLLSSGFDLKAGKSFSQGQLLFKINDKEAQLALKARKSGFLNIVAIILPDIRIDFPSNAQNWDNFFNSIDLDSPLPDLPKFSSSKEKTFLAAKNILTEYYNIKGDEERIKKYNVYAPFNGSIVDVSSEVGTTVSPGPPIANIIKTVALEVTIPISPEYVPLIKEGNSVELLSEDKTNSWKGKVSRIAKNINENTQSVDVYISIENDQTSSLYNGMYLEAKIEAIKVQNASEIPRRAMLDNGKVYIVKDSMLLQQSLEIINRNKSSLVVTGLKDELLVVVEPIPGAVDSMKVAPIVK